MSVVGGGEAPFVGRDAGMAELAAALRAAEVARGSFLLVTGEAGIGKTRLVDELCAQAGGFRVVWCWCGLAAEESLHPWPSVARTLAADNAAISRLVQRSTGLSGAVTGLDPGPGRDRFADDVAEMLTIAAGEQPLLLVLDDLHAAGASSLRFLAHVIPTVRTAPILVCGTARDDDFAWRAADDVRGMVVRQARRVSLGPLDRADVAELVRSMAGDLTDDAASTIAERTGGNPLFVVELVRLARDGLDPRSARAPVSVRAIVAERTAEFEESCRRLLAAAAVLGTRFRLDVLADTADVDLADVRGALDDAVRAGLVSLTDPGAGTFTHDLVCDAIADALAPAERAQWHQRAAAAMEVLADRGRGIGTAEIARHLLEAGPEHAGRAATLAWRAGDEAQRVTAYEDAARWYEQANDCLAATDAGAARRSELLLALGDARLACGDRAGARREFLSAATLARDAQDAALLARAALGLGSGPAGFEVDLFDRVQLDVLEEARGKLPDDSLGLRSLVAARLSVALTMVEGEDRRVDLADEAVALARGADEPAALAYALSALCDARAGPADAANRVAWTDEMMRAAGVRRDAGLELLARRLRLVARLELGDFAAADAEVREFEMRAETFRHPLYSWYVPLWRGMRALMEGRFDDCATANREVEALAERAGSNNVRVLGATQRWCLFAETGDRRGVETMRAMLVDLQGQALWVQVGLALAAAQLGNVDDARRGLDTAAPGLPDVPRDSEWLAVLAQVAETVAVVGGHPVAEWVYATLAPYAQYYVVEGIGAAVRGPVHRHLGLLAAVSGDETSARAHFDAALDMCGAVGAVQLVARIEAEAAALVGERPGLPPPDENVFRIDGELWTLRFAGEEVHVRDAKGLHDLAVLVGAPGREVAAIDLSGSVVGGDAGPVVDSAAREAYRRRLVELEEDLDDATAGGDLGRAERLAAERDALVEQLAQAYGLGGRGRRAGSLSERARSRVTARIRDAVRRIEAVHPELGRHLDRSVRTGTFCVYRPDPPVEWKV